MLAAEKPDVVDVCTPPATHVDVAVAAMQAGCHVLIEKPMALSVPDCDTIVEAAKRFAVSACVVHSDLFYPSFLRARRLVREGAVGDFRGMRIFLSTPTTYMTARQDHWAHRLPGGVFGETGPHAVYMSLAFLGRIDEVSVDAIRALPYAWSPFDDYRINLVGPRGMSSITLAYGSDQWAARVDVLGATGTLEVDLEGMCVVRHRRTALTPLAVGTSLVRHSAQLLGGLAANAVAVGLGRRRSPHDVVVAEFVDSLRRKQPAPVPAEEGREAVRVMSLIADRLRARYGRG
jgi:predicted dehydrogenase